MSGATLKVSSVWESLQVAVGGVPALASVMGAGFGVMGADFGSCTSWVLWASSSSWDSSCTSNLLNSLTCAANAFNPQPSTVSL